MVFAGTPRGLESRLVPRAGYALELLPILPLNGVGLARTLLGLVVLPWGLLKSALARAAAAARGGARDRRLRRRPGDAARRAARRARGDPRAERPPRLHEPRPAALRGRRGLCLRRGARVVRGEGRADRQPGPRRLRGAAAERAPAALHAARLRRQPGLARAQPGARRRAAVAPGARAAAHRAPDRARDARPGGGGLPRGQARPARWWRSSTTWSGASARPTWCSPAAARPPARSCCVAGKAAILVPFAGAADDHQTTNARALEAKRRGPRAGGEGAHGRVARRAP